MSELLFRIRRGSLELDILLSRFVKHGYDGLSKEEQDTFYQWLLLEDHALLEKIKASEDLGRKIIAMGKKEGPQ